VYIKVGYGLEGALPDALCHTIIENEITPRFRAGDFAGGLGAATAAIIAATKGEYRGTGRTNTDAQGGSGPIVFGVFIFIVILISIINRMRPGRNTTFGRRRSLYDNTTTGFWGGFGGGSGGGWSSGGGGGFSGGGGSFGGGGSGGSW
jgi:uncharacterized protein